MPITKDINEQTFCFLEVPEEAEFFDVFKGYLYYELFSEESERLEGFEEKLHSGNLEIIERASELSESDWGKIVAEMPVGERYANYCGDYPIWYHNRKESGLSLLRSLSLKPETTLILKHFKLQSHDTNH